MQYRLLEGLPFGKNGISGSRRQKHLPTLCIFWHLPPLFAILSPYHLKLCNGKLLACLNCGHLHTGRDVGPNVLYDLHLHTAHTPFSQLLCHVTKAERLGSG